MVPSFQAFGPGTPLEDACDMILLFHPYPLLFLPLPCAPLAPLPTCMS